jgi:hypothetical protein
MTFDVEVVSDNNYAHRASYRLSVSEHSSYSSYTVALFNLGQTVATQAKLAVAIDADGYLYIQTNAIWNCSLHVTLLYSASSNFSITMNRLGYAPFGTESGFTPVKIITQTGGFRIANGVVSDELTPIINTNIIGNVTGNADTATNAATADKWKTARNISISDADGTNTGSAVSVDGSENETLKLPTTIKASITGNADTSTKLANARTITIAGDATGSTTFDGSANKTLTLSVTKATNATTADKWKTARNITISDADGTNTGSAVSVDGSENETLKLPATIKATLSGNASTATAPLYQWRKADVELYRYAPGESPDKTYYWFRVCNITTAMTFDLELSSDSNLVYRASYRLSVTKYSSDTYTVALLNLGQTVATHAKLAVALDADGYLYIQTNCLWTSYLFVTLLYSASSNFSITMNKLGYAPFGTASGFTPVKIITQTGGFRVSNGAVVGTDISPIIHTNIIGNLTGNADTATKLANARKINGVSFDGSTDITIADSTKAPINNPTFTGTVTAPTPATETNNTQIATTAFVKNQNYEPNRGTGTNSLALGASSEASGVYSTALGTGSEASGNSSIALGAGTTASGDGSTALGVSSIASGNYSIAFGAGATASRDYQITIGTKFVYFRFASTETEATVYDALSPWVNPTAGSNQGAMGSLHNFEVRGIQRLNSTTIDLLVNTPTGTKSIRSGNTTPITSNLAICTVKY